MSPAQNSIVPERVTELREALHLSQADLAKRVGTSQQSIDQIERGKVRRPRVLHEIARALGVDPDYLLGLRPSPDREEPVISTVSEPVPMPAGKLPYAGIVRAGLWMPVDMQGSQDEGDYFAPPSIPRHPAYMHLPQHAYKIEGNSMDEVGIHDGMWAVVAPYLDYRDKVAELDNGNYVIAERKRAGGSERELTVKEVQFGREGMRLVPRSSDPVHTEFFIPYDDEADSDEEEVSIIGVVLGVFRDMDPRAR